jgi:hypothetical protein
MQAPQRLWAVAQDFAKPTRSELLIQVPETPFRSNSAAGNGSTGILNTGALTLASGSTFSVDLEGSVAGTGYDQVFVTGADCRRDARQQRRSFGCQDRRLASAAFLNPDDQSRASQ